MSSGDQVERAEVGSWRPALKTMRPRIWSSRRGVRDGEAGGEKKRRMKKMKRKGMLKAVCFHCSCIQALSLSYGNCLSVSRERCSCVGVRKEERGDREEGRGGWEKMEVGRRQR